MTVVCSYGHTVALHTHPKEADELKASIHTKHISSTDVYYTQRQSEAECVQPLWATAMNCSQVRLDNAMFENGEKIGNKGLK